MEAATPKLTDSTGRGIRKSAVLVLTLGEDIGAAILRELAEHEVEAVLDEISRIEAVPQGERQQIVHEFLQGIAADRTTASGGQATAERLVKAAFGPEESGRYVAAMQQRSEDARRDQEMDPERMAQILAHEHPQAVALYLTRLTAELRARVLAALPTVERTRVAQKLARLQKMSPQVADHVTASIRAKLEQTTTTTRHESFGGVKALAELCAHMPPDVMEELLATMEKDDTDLVEEVRNQMFTFEDILGLNVRAVPAITERVERSVLSLALKGTSEEMKEHMMQQMSQRAKAMLLDEIEALGAVRIRDVQEAQQEIIAVVHELEKEGVISLHGDEKEEYVT